MGLDFRAFGRFAHMQQLKLMPEMPPWIFPGPSMPKRRLLALEREKPQAYISHWIERRGSGRTGWAGPLLQA